MEEANMKSRTRGGATGVLGRMSDASTTGILASSFVPWRDHMRTETRARNMEETIAAQEHKFKSLNSKQKGNAKSAAQSAIELEEHNIMMNIFMNWKTEVEIQAVITHYSGKMKSKKEHLQ